MGQIEATGNGWIKVKDEEISIKTLASYSKIDFGYDEIEDGSLYGIEIISLTKNDGQPFILTFYKKEEDREADWKEMQKAANECYDNL